MIAFIAGHIMDLEVEGLTGASHREGSPTRINQREQFPDWAALPIEPLNSAGTDNAIYRLGGDMAVRLPLRPVAAEQVEKENRWLPSLAPYLPLGVPVPLALGMPAESYPYPWSVCRWLEGENAVVAPIADLEQAALALAQFVSYPRFKKSIPRAALNQGPITFFAACPWQAEMHRLGLPLRACAAASIPTR